MEIVYPTESKVIELNMLVLALIKVKKADQPKILSRSKITQAIVFCRSYEGDVYDKAAVLIKELIKVHAFASGNRRTAFVVTKYFISQNKGKLKIRDDPNHAKVMQGIREDYYSHDEIRDWIKNGKIREFRR
jgi:death-on-curing family protein